MSDEQSGKPIFRTLGKYFNNDGADITYGNHVTSANPNSTVKPNGFFYSENIINSSVTYEIPLTKSIVTGYILTSFWLDIYALSWDFYGSNDNISFNLLHRSDTPLCDNHNTFQPDHGRYICNENVSKSYTFNNANAYRFYKIKMNGGNSFTEGWNSNYKYIFIFSSLELYGEVFIPWIVHSVKCSKTHNYYILFITITLFS